MRGDFRPSTLRHAVTRGSARRLLKALLLADLAMIAVHVVNRATIDVRPLRIDIEFGTGEVFQYLKLLAAAAVLASLARRSGQAGTYLWAAALTYLALDDAFAFHEWFSARWGDLFDLESGAVASQFAGDLVVAVVVLGAALLAYRLRAPSARHAAALLAGLITYGVFAGAVDVAARFSFVLERRWLRGVFAVVEEGGEMLAISVVLTVAVAAWRDGTQPAATDLPPRVA